jgi:hypothetical protein
MTSDSGLVLAGCRYSGRGSPVKVLRLKTLVRMGVAVDFDKFASSTPACLVAPAIRTKSIASAVSERMNE